MRVPWENPLVSLWAELGVACHVNPWGSVRVSWENPLVSLWAELVVACHVNPWGSGGAGTPKEPSGSRFPRMG